MGSGLPNTIDIWQLAQQTGELRELVQSYKGRGYAQLDYVQQLDAALKLVDALWEKLDGG